MQFELGCRPPGGKSKRRSSSPHPFSPAARHGCDKPVATSRQRFYEARVLRAITQGIPQFTYGAVDRVIEVDICVFTPEAPLNFLSRNDFAGMLQQNKENLKRLVLQL